MSKALNWIRLPIIILIAILVQVILANNFEIFGVTPNVILVTVVIISMWSNICTAAIYTIGLGIIADFLFNFNIGQSFISYLVIALSISYIGKKYRKDSKAAIVYITIISTFAFSTFEYMYYIISNAIFINIFAALKQTIIEILLNIALAYVLYKIFEKSMKKKKSEEFYM